MHKLIRAFVFGLAASMTAVPAAAQLTVTVGVVPQVDDNLLSTGGSGNPVTLVTNGTGYQVTVQGTENLVTPAAGLQATVAPADGGLSTLTFSLAAAGSTFTSLILNLDSSQDGTVTFTDSASGTSSPFALDDNGSNFFTLTGGPFTSLSFNTFVSGVETAIITNVTSMRLGGVTTSNNPPGVPEPETWSFMLLGLGIAGLALRKAKNASVRLAA